VTFSAEVELGGPLRLAVQDDLGNIAVGEGGKSELAFHRELTQTMLQTELFKTAGTPFLCQNVRCKIQKGISLSQQDIAYVRDKVLAELMEKRKALSARSTGDFTVFPKIDNSPELPVLTVSVLHADQLSQQLLELAPPVVYVPLEEIYGNEDKIRQFTNTPGISVCAVLPCTIYEGETEEVKDMLVKAKSMGVTDVLVENIGHIMFVRQMGFNVRGGSGLNALSSGSLVALRSFKLSSVTLSTELSREEISKISKYVPSELVVYGRLPLMVTDNCIVRNITGTCSCDSFSGIADSTGMIMPLIKSHDCRNTLYSSKKLFLGRMSGEYMNSGLWGVRLAFTTENPRECAAITERFLGMGTFEPTAYTRGNF
jgi:putative protease